MIAGGFFWHKVGSSMKKVNTITVFCRNGAAGPLRQREHHHARERRHLRGEQGPTCVSPHSVPAGASSTTLQLCAAMAPCKFLPASSTGARRAPVGTLKPLCLFSEPAFGHRSSEETL